MLTLSIMGKAFSDTLRLCTRSASVLIVCPRCGAATKAPNGPAAGPIPRKTNTKAKRGFVDVFTGQSLGDNVSLIKVIEKATKPPKSATSKKAEKKEPVDPSELDLRKVFRATRSLPGEMYLGNEALADKIASLMSISSDSDSIIMEGNPGMGYLTQAILERGAKRMRIFENRAVFIYRLQKLQKIYGAKRLEIICPYNIYDHRKKSVKKSDRDAIAKRATVLMPPDLLAGRNPMEIPSVEQRFEELVNRGLTPMEWTSATPAVKFFSVTPELTGIRLIRRIIDQVSRRRGFSNLGRPEFFLLAPPNLTAMMQAGSSETAPNFRSIRWVSIALQAFFEVTILQSASRDDLLPPMSKLKRKAGDNWSLVRLTARRDLPEIIDWSLLPEFVFFVRQAMISRNRSVIAFLEGWIPGYGRRLIDLGMDFYIRSGYMTAQQFVELFRGVAASPEYAASNLKNAFFSSGQMGMVDAEEEDDDVEDEQIVPQVKVYARKFCGAALRKNCSAMDVDDLEQNALLSAFQTLTTDNKDDLVVQFQTLSGQAIERSTCEFFLEMNNWNLQQSICAYYDLEAKQENLPQMAFVQDVTIGEGDSVSPSTNFTKTWRIRNSGWDNWPPGCALRFTGTGLQMTHIDLIALPPLQSGEEHNASVEMVSPALPGIYHGQWRMISPTGMYCGETIWVFIQVAENGILGITQKMSSMPLGEHGSLNSSRSVAFQSAKNPFASNGHHSSFPGNNSPTMDDGKGNTDMDDAP
ncbi:C6orf106-like protein [Hypsibius exemplaris]|uniref:C6orf106-like protein n=1 Tax=Hypsibius exemplaris TaxID=2072580 RepID=A0A9X6NG82_HYPEX|nr:C6orf106-like protein [Hypsibius exemplaris]